MKERRGEQKEKDEEEKEMHEQKENRDGMKRSRRRITSSMSIREKERTGTRQESRGRK
jgi:hypothetical protein